MTPMGPGSAGLGFRPPDTPERRRGPARAWARRLAYGLGGVGVLAALIVGAAPVLRDWRITVRDVAKLDPPPGPAALRIGRQAFSVVGAVVRPGEAHQAVLRAWSPTPALSVMGPAGTDPVTIRIDNLPARVRLVASGPVDETRAGPSRTLRFAPVATRRLAFVAPADQVTFAVLGDTGDSSVFTDALRAAAAGGADFFLHVGDLIYADGQMPHVAQILAAAPLPVYVARGNHDYRNRARIAFMRALGPAYYAFRIGRATFVILDNADDYLPGLWRRSSQYRWWTEVLGEPREGPLFVGMHRPPFDRRGDPRRHASMLEAAFARQLMQDFESAGVVAVLTGHVHGSYLWVQDGIPYVVSGEGSESSEGPASHRMAWVRVRGWDVAIEQTRIPRP